MIGNVTCYTEIFNILIILFHDETQSLCPNIEKIKICYMEDPIASLMLDTIMSSLCCIFQSYQVKPPRQWCSVCGGAGPFWAVRWCWSGSLCRAGAGLLTFLEHPIMCPPLLEDLAKWFSWMMAYCSLQMCDLIWFKFQNCCKTTKTKGWSTLNILQGTWHACLAKFVENKVWETHCSEALTVSSVNVYFKSPDVLHLISTSQGTSQGMSLYCYRGSL